MYFSRTVKFCPFWVGFLTCSKFLNWWWLFEAIILFFKMFSIDLSGSSAVFWRWFIGVWCLMHACYGLWTPVSVDTWYLKGVVLYSWTTWSFFENDHSNNKVYLFVFCKEFINAWFFAISVMLHWVLGMFQSEFCIWGNYNAYSRTVKYWQQLVHLSNWIS